MTYKDTIFLPKTDFPMKANLAIREVEILKRWQDMNLYQTQRDLFKDRPLFILHDGPPYANGNIHIGHALNRILKDVVMRSQQMLGKNCPFVPGWDCHGLPIEWKIEENYRKKKLNKDEVDVLEFRQECRQFAAHWLDVQREEVKRLGLSGDWANPYVTMDFETEGVIADELSKFLLNGSMYQGFRPIMWSVVEKTALAEAEVEYKDHTSPSIYVRFQVVSEHPKLKDTKAVIWTTTPWTIPANRGIAYGEDIDYVVIQVDVVTEGKAHKGLATEGERLLLAKALVDVVAAEAGIASYTVVQTLKGAELKGAICHHPLQGEGYDFEVPFIAGHHVTTDAGTGLVHTAPSHGVDDFEIGKKFGLEIPQLLSDDGYYHDHVPLFAGKHIYKVHTDVIAELTDSKRLLAHGSLVHSYPHSWRSKAPLIYRTTPQWFISMETNNLRSIAVSEIKKVRWVPESGINRILGMVEGRPDWCISRQRSWGVPLPIFMHKVTKEPLRDEKIQQRVVDAFKKEGADAWYKYDVAYFLHSDYKAEDYEKSMDVVDVWFDSGTTHVFTLENRPGLRSPADLYLEGSDQHRGWFQSSLLESCGTRGRAPYKAVLTHGFVLDEKGYKMSKSLGNVVAPQEIVEKMGADVLRLWVVNSDYFDDIRIGQSILQHQQDIYRRFRNTLRYLLGALSDFSDSEIVSYAEMPELEQWMLNNLCKLQKLAEKAIESYDFRSFYSELHNFCAVELSAFYLDMRKDSLYCDDPKGLKRRAVRSTMHYIFECLSRWLAPVLCFTAEEAYTSRHGDGAATSVHLQTFYDIPAEWNNEQLEEKWATIQKIRSEITSAIEIKRAEKFVGSSLQAYVKVLAPQDLKPVMEGLDWAEIAITSGAEVLYRVQENLSVEVTLAAGEKCERCWKIDEVVTEDKPLCSRCAEVVEHAL